jgi:hypothetical protein
LINHVDYTLELETILTPLNSGSFNRSITTAVYKSVDDPNTIVSLELIEFEGTPKLSKIYNDIAHAVHKIGKEYALTSDEYLNVLNNRYITIEDEIKFLSQSVETYMNNYDLKVEKSVAILFDACDVWTCIMPNWSGCYGHVGELTFACVAGCALACIVAGPFYGACVMPCLLFCADLDLAYAVGCLAYALTLCCAGGGGGGGGGGCPILTVYDGSAFVSEGLLDIHSDFDITRTFFLDTTPVSVDNRYLMRLTEHHQTRSHLDQVRLFARISDGILLEILLASAIHVTEGDVLMQLSYSDDLRVIELGADHNNGTSQYIDLQFVVPEGIESLQFMLVIEGYNEDAKV